MKSKSFAYAKRVVGDGQARAAYYKRVRRREERRNMQQQLHQHDVLVGEVTPEPVSRPYGHDAWNIS